MRDAGYGVVSLDIQYGVHGDLLVRVVERLIKGWIRSGLVLGIFLGTPCTSWSRALRQPLRSAPAPMGLTNLTDSQHARLKWAMLHSLSLVD